MSSLRNPKNWAPYINTKDCSQGFCSIYCPQWCYIIFPPSPPFKFPDEDSRSMFSPLVIAIIGVLASAFLLVSYYLIVTKYCKDRGPGMEEHEFEDMEIIHQAPALHESWHFTANNGLDEALVKLITVVQYKRGDGLVEGTECSVCISEFEDGERLRLLPKCSHAFHLPCIDMWLKSHSNCPLCRANIISGQPLPAIAENSFQNQSSEPQDENLVMEEIEETMDEESGIITGNDAALKGLDNMGFDSRDRYGEPVRRSLSMGYIGFSLADALLINQDDDSQQRARRSNYVHSALRRPITMKRSFSSGIFFARKDATGHNSTTIPF